VSDISKHIWIIPDTNILGNKGTREALINVLRQFKDKNIEIGLPQIPIEESPKKDQSEQRTRSLSLYEIINKHFDEEGILYLQHLEEIKSEFPNDCCPAEEVPIALTVDVSRVGDEKHSYSYFVDEKTEEFLSKAIQKYIEKEAFSALKNLEHCGLESNQKDDVEKFQYALQFCLNLPNSADKGCKGHCKELYRVLGDILTLSPAYYLYYYQKEDNILVVSNDETMCETFNELVNDLFKGKDFTEEKKLIKCVNLKELEEFLKNAPETLQIDPQKLAKGFLDKALEDIRASEILYRENLQDLAIFHLEQASEKILKAYAISFLSAEGSVVISINVPNKYEKIHKRIKEIISQLHKPKNLNHDIINFLNKKFGNLYYDMCKADFEGYLEFLLNSSVTALNKQKSMLKRWFLSKGLNEEQAENGANSFISFNSQIINQLITYIKNSNLKNNICEEKVKKLIPSEKLLNEIMESSEPCLYNKLGTYQSITKELRDLIKKAIDSNPKVIEVIGDIFMSPKLIDDENLKTLIQDLLYNIVSPIFLPLLHICLNKYYSISRYPEGKIPEEEYKAVPETIELLKKVHKSVEDLIQAPSELEPLYEQVITQIFSNN